MESSDELKDGQVANYLLVYLPRSETTAWWARWFTTRDFAHVEIWWSIGDGFYTAIRPYHHFLVVDIMQGEPEGVIQSVRAERRHRWPMLPFGMKTCVTVAKAVVGIRDARIITPRQLFNYVEKRKGVL